MRIEVVEEAAFEMANVSKDDTGLPYNLWIDSRGKDRQVGHANSPRIKMEVDGKLVPVLISDDPKIPESAKKNGAKEPRRFNEVREYVRAYFPVFMAHYLKMISDRQALVLLNTIENASDEQVLALAKKLKNMDLGDIGSDN